MARPADMVLTPTSELLIAWDDGHTSVYDPIYLRRRCPCARCKELEKELAKPKKGLLMAQGPAPEEIEAVSLAEVGNYAVAIRWQDGHDTGIYAYRYLRSICPCDACRAAAARGPEDGG